MYPSSDADKMASETTPQINQLWKYPKIEDTRYVSDYATSYEMGVPISGPKGQAGGRRVGNVVDGLVARLRLSTPIR